MRGHLPLIAMRREGIRPESVWFSLDLPDTSETSADWQHWSKFASVDIGDTEGVGRLDVRFVVGMRVHIQGLNRERCKALHLACMAAKAERVLTHVTKPSIQRRGNFETVLMLIDDQTIFEAEQ